MAFSQEYNTSRNEKLKKLVHLFRILQRLNRFVTEDMESSLSIAESLLLYELDGDSNRSLSELATIMELDKATISRTLKNLSEAKILKISKNPEDGRRIVIEIAAKGRKILEANDRDSNGVLDWYLEYLLPTEKPKIERYFKLLADNVGTPSSLLRANDHPIRVEMRRLAKSLGYLKDNIYGTEFSPAEWQVIATINLAPIRSNPAFLAYILSTPPSFMSRLLSGLVKRGYIRRPRAVGDSRSREIYLTPKGEEAFVGIESAGISFFQKNLSDLGDEELSHFCSIFSHFIRELEDGKRLVSRDKFTRLMISEIDQAKARGFILREITQKGLEEKIPSELGSRNQVFSGLFCDGTLVGVSLIQVDAFGEVPRSNIVPARLICALDKVSPNERAQWMIESASLILDYVRGYRKILSIDSSHALIC